MKRENLTIGQKVLVIPPHTNKDVPAPKSKYMYVQELKEGTCAGLSHRINEKRHIYGILYEVINVIN